MPYIPRIRQEKLDPHIQNLLDQMKIDNMGDLEYVFFAILLAFSHGDMRKFAQMNSLIGVLETTKAEFIKRVMGPYESLKLIDSWYEGNETD